MKTIITTLAMFVAAASAQAASTWNYQIEPARMISGGKVKISTLTKGKGFRQIKFKYKLDTAVGEKQAWFPYNLPEQMFSGAFLKALPLGQTVSLGSLPNAVTGEVSEFSIVRQTKDAFLVTTNDGEFRFYPRTGSGAWKRIEFTIRGQVTIRLYGNLLEVTNE